MFPVSVWKERLRYAFREFLRTSMLVLTFVFFLPLFFFFWIVCALAGDDCDDDFWCYD